MDFMHIWGQKEAIWNTFFSINLFGHGVLENQIQGLSRTMSVFKHFPDLENLEKKFKDCKSPVNGSDVGMTNYTKQIQMYIGPLFIHNRSIILQIQLNDFQQIPRNSRQIPRDFQTFIRHWTLSLQPVNNCQGPDFQKIIRFTYIHTYIHTYENL